MLAFLCLWFCVGGFVMVVLCWSFCVVGFVVVVFVNGFF